MPDDTMKQELKETGFLIRDDFLPQPLFETLQAEALTVWDDSSAWETRIKGPGDPVSLPRQGRRKLRQISQLLDQQKVKRPEMFTYAYHCLKENATSAPWLDKVTRHLINGWQHEIARLEIQPQSSQFSLTAFTHDCYLDPHTDYSPQHEKPYRLTLILYFQHARSSGNGGCLEFDYMGEKRCVLPKPNRSVLFIPTDQTIHSVPSSSDPLSAQTGPRLALSGWLI